MTTTAITLSDFLIGRPMTATGFDALDGANHKTHRAAKILRGDTAVTHLYWPAREGKGADVAEALRRLGIGSDLTQFRAQGTWQGLDAAGLLLWHRGESTEEAPAPKPRRGRKSAAERNGISAEAHEVITTAKTVLETPDGEAPPVTLDQAEALVAVMDALPPATDADLQAAGITLESLAEASARAAAEAPAPKPKPEPKPVHPAAEVGSPEWKALLHDATVLWVAGEKDAAALLLVEAHEAGVPIKPLDTLARYEKQTRGLAKAWWNLWKTRPGYTGKDVRTAAPAPAVKGRKGRKGAAA